MTHHNIATDKGEHVAIEVFNRQELKFVISMKMYDELRPVLEQRMQLDKHNTGGKPYTLYNLYLDTPDNQLIRRSLDKPVYKEKLRIRSYHQLDSDQPVFLELKKRYKKITNKRRTKIQLNDALTLATTGTVPQRHDYMNYQVIDEFEAICSSQDFEPKVYITYDRQAYTVNLPGEDLRVTFDMNLRAQLFGSNEVSQLLPSDKIIMEVKTMWGIPLWLTDLLTEKGIQRRSFSKYGTEYRQRLQQLTENPHA